MTLEIGWLVAGILLVIVELMTGTFYLLILGIAAIAASIVAWSGGTFWMQAAIAGAVAIGGLFFVVNRRRDIEGQGSIEPIDIGQPAAFEAWRHEPDRLAQVRYRGATWDAVVEGDGAVAAGATLYVTAVQGNRLKVSTRQP